MSLFADITSKDPQRIWSSSCAIRTLRDPEQLQYLASRLEEINASVKGVELGGASRPNSTHLAFALQKLELVISSKECLCSLYALDDLFDPNNEKGSGNVAVTGVVHIDGNWVDYYECQCAVCGKRFNVEEREYHYTWWAWKSA
jgi:hypothetical protein